jgi:hypothetical protein
MKKNWIKVLCNKMKRPTGWMGEPSNRIHQCMAIEKKLLKNHSGLMGFSSLEDKATMEGGGGSEENAL